MVDLVVVTGPPGAGKTTVARAVSRRFESSAVVAGDDFFAFIDQGYLPPWIAAAHHQNEIVIEAAAAAGGRLAAGGYYVLYDGVVGPWFLNRFAAATGLAQLHYAMLLPPEDTCIERVRSRVGHSFTDEYATRQMYRQFADADIDDRHVVTSVGTAETIASTVFELVLAGSLRHAIDGTTADP